MESHFKIGNVNYSRTDYNGIVCLTISVDYVYYTEVISNESEIAKEAIKEVLNYKNGFESKAIPV